MTFSASKHWASGLGLNLTNVTRYQKILLVCGPPRSGKSTMLSVLRHVVGPECCVNPRMDNLNTQFGLASLLGNAMRDLPRRPRHEQEQRTGDPGGCQRAGQNVPVKGRSKPAT